MKSHSKGQVNHLKQNRLGRSSLLVSEVGFGCMSLGTDRQNALNILHRAFDLGINFFDTADLYNQGENEELVGEAFADRRQDVIIATKVGNRFEAGKPGWTWDASPRYIKEAVERSLNRLKTDYIDLYQLHGGTMEDDFEGIVETMESLKERGLIRAYGISSIRPTVILRYLGGSNIDSIMMQYSLLDRRPEEWLSRIADAGVSVIARGPLANGLLASKGKHLGADDAYLDRDAVQVANAIHAVESMTTSARSASQVALRYALHAGVVATAVPGASRIEQLEENARTANVDALTASEINLLQKTIQANDYTQHRP